MTERKKIKILKGTEENLSLLELLKSIRDDTSSVEKINFDQSISSAIENLKYKENRVISFQILAELSRISFKTVENVFKERNLVVFCFNALLETLRDNVFDISPLISSGLPVLMNDESILARYLDFYPKCHLNRPAIRELLSLFIENLLTNPNNKSQEHYEVIEKILEKYQKYRDLIPRIAKFINYDTVQEDLYVDLFIDCPYVREHVELRVVKGKRRLSYLEKLVETNLDFAIENYVRDRDGKIRTLLARKILNSLDKYLSEPGFSFLLNDPDEEIRFLIISNLNWRLGLDPVAERVLDKSSKVRSAAFELYKKGLSFMRENFSKLIFSTDFNFLKNENNGKLNFLKSTDSPTSELTNEEREMHLELFNLFVKKLCLGCLTGFSLEYVQILTDSSFSLDYLSEQESNPGIHVFLSSMTVKDIDFVKIHLQPLVLRHMFKGILTHNQIINCISADIFEVLKFIPTPSTYYTELLEKAISTNDLGVAEKISEFLKQILKTKSIIYPVKNNGENEMNESGIFNQDIPSSNPSGFDSPNLYFINAHTQTSDLFNEQQLHRVDYPSIYFQIYKIKNDPLVLKNMKNSKISTDQKIRLLLYLNDPEAVESFSSDFLCYPLNRELEKLILEKKNMTSSLIYFLCTGMVSISHSSFFIRCVKCCIKAFKGVENVRSFKGNGEDNVSPDENLRGKGKDDIPLDGNLKGNTGVNVNNSIDGNLNDNGKGNVSIDRNLKDNTDEKVDLKDNTGDMARINENIPNVSIDKTLKDNVKDMNNFSIDKNIKDNTGDMARINENIPNVSLDGNLKGNGDEKVNLKDNGEVKVVLKDNTGDMARINVNNPNFSANRNFKEIVSNAPFNRNFKIFENKVHSLFSNYLKTVPQKTFDLFYSICYALKSCSVNKINPESKLETNAFDESLIISPMITENLNGNSDKTSIVQSTVIDLVNGNENIVNDIVVNSIDKEKRNFEVLTGNEKFIFTLSIEDKILHSICNFIVTLRPGEIIPIQFDSSKYGFYKLTDVQYEMICHGQVKYQ